MKKMKFRRGLYLEELMEVLGPERFEELRLPECPEEPRCPGGRSELFWDRFRLVVSTNNLAAYYQVRQKKVRTVSPSSDGRRRGGIFVYNEDEIGWRSISLEKTDPSPPPELMGEAKRLQEELRRFEEDPEALRQAQMAYLRKEEAYKAWRGAWWVVQRLQARIRKGLPLEEVDLRHVLKAEDLRKLLELQEIPELQG